MFCKYSGFRDLHKPKGGRICAFLSARVGDCKLSQVPPSPGWQLWERCRKTQTLYACLPMRHRCLSTDLGQRRADSQHFCLSSASFWGSLLLWAQKLGSFPTLPSTSPRNVFISFPVFHLPEVSVFLWKDFSERWPLWVFSALLACTCCDSFALICAMSNRQGPSETLLPATG